VSAENGFHTNKTLFSVFESVHSRVPGTCITVKWELGTFWSLLAGRMLSQIPPVTVSKCRWKSNPGRIRRRV